MTELNSQAKMTKSISHKMNISNLECTAAKPNMLLSYERNQAIGDSRAELNWSKAPNLRVSACQALRCDERLKMKEEQREVKVISLGLR